MSEVDKQVLNGFSDIVMLMTLRNRLNDNLERLRKGLTAWKDTHFLNQKQ